MQRPRKKQKVASTVVRLASPDLVVLEEQRVAGPGQAHHRMAHLRALPPAEPWAVALLLALLGCAPAPEMPTHWEDVAPVVEQRCQGCHREDGIAPFSFDDEAAVRSMAPQIADAVATRRMPPWPAEQPCRPIEGDLTLSDEEVAALVAWANAGAPMGRRRESSAPSAEPEALSGPVLTVDMGADYISAAQQDDDYRCFAVDPRLDSDAYVVQSRVLPGNRRVVHHVILFSVAGEHASTLEQLDERDAGPGFDCLTGTGVAAQWVTAWAPGSGTWTAPSGTGIRLDKGSRLVMQVHYNLLKGRTEADRTRIELVLAREPIRAAFMVPVTQSLLALPAGQSNIEVGFRYQLPENAPDVTIYGAMAHMHLLGKRYLLEVERSSGDSACLLRIPRWNFHWQRLYMYREPLVVRAGDTLRMTCIYDNSAENQPFVGGVQRAPRTVYWGEGTLDEMCLALLYVTGEVP